MQALFKTELKAIDSEALIRSRLPRRRTVRLFVICALVAMVANSHGAFARQGTPPRSNDYDMLTDTASIAAASLPAINVELARTLAEAAPEPGPYQVAEVIDLSLGLGHGTWELVPGGKIWRLRIDGPGALHLNFGFGTFRLPDGATLHVISVTDETRYIGPYTAADNSPLGLWTPMIPGNSAVIEIWVPDGAGDPSLEITRAGMGFVDLFGLDPTRHELGACYIDAVCPKSFMDDVERGVVRLLIDGGGLCTGSLINDVGSTRRPFILTADHCGITAAKAPTVVALFNFKVATCGGSTPGPETDTVSGSTLRATRTDVDGTLLELNSTPPSSYSVFYVGWDRSNTAPAKTTGVHHPKGTSMAFSLDNNPAVTINSCIGTGGVNSHWDVNWDDGVTAPGSSGSGLFDFTSRRVLGFLSGGESKCAGTATQGCCDCYGKFSTFWDGPSPASRLKDWLDPGNTGTMMVDGVEGVVVTRNLTVTKAGTGSGTVTSNPPGINCGGTCAASFSDNAAVTLTAAAGAGGMVFAGWGGACATSGANTTCNLTMDGDKAVTATFNRPDPCTSAINVFCAETYSGTTVGASNDFSNYSCSGDPQSGNDVLHKLTPPESGSVTVDLNNFTGDLDLLALTACNTGNCTTSSETTSSTEQVTFAAVQGMTYYLVVEDYDNTGSTYNLTATCPCAAPQGATEDLFGNTVSSTQSVYACFLLRVGQGTEVTASGNLTIRSQTVEIQNGFSVAGQLTVRND